MSWLFFDVINQISLQLLLLLLGSSFYLLFQAAYTHYQSKYNINYDLFIDVRSYYYPSLFHLFQPFETLLKITHLIIIFDYNSKYVSTTYWLLYIRLSYIENVPRRVISYSRWPFLLGHSMPNLSNLWTFESNSFYCLLLIFYSTYRQMLICSDALQLSLMLQMLFNNLCIHQFTH